MRKHRIAFVVSSTEMVWERWRVGVSRHGLGVLGDQEERLELICKGRIGIGQVTVERSHCRGDDQIVKVPSRKDGEVPLRT